MTLAVISKESDHDFSDRELLFVEFLEGIDFARRHGFPPNATIVGFAPAVQAFLRDHNDNPTDWHRRLAASPELNGFSDRLARELVESVDVASLGDVAHLCLQRVAVRLQPLAMRAACVSNTDCARKIAIVEFVDAPSAARLGNSWSDLFTGADVLVVRLDAPRSAAEYRPAPGPVSRRFGRGSFQKVLGDALIKAWGQLSLDPKGSSFLVLSSNELVRETAFHLMAKGIPVRQLAPETALVSSVSAVTEEMKLAVRDAIYRVTRDLAPETLAVAVAKHGVVLAESELQAFSAALPRWRRKLAHPRASRARAILANLPKSPADIAAYQAATEAGIPFVCFQHGVSRELSVVAEEVRCVTENAMSDLFVAFNDTASRIADSNPFKRAPSISVGLPSEYWHCGDFRRPVANFPPVMYVSTALYASAQNIRRGQASDHEMAAREIAIVEDVLGQLPHRVAFKPYPALRYLDPDPIISSLKIYKNIELIDTEIDARYLLVDSKIIVTGRGTSTLSWCIMSGKPLIFFDHKDSIPLRTENRKLFEAAIFVFDADTSSGRQAARAFLSLPLNEIEAKAKAKAEARARLVETHFGRGGPGAGRRAADMLLERYRLK